MKKRNIMLITALSVAFVLFSVTAFAALNTADGYDVFKDVMENEQEYDNATIDYSFSFVDGDDVIMSSTGTIKADGDEDNKTASGNIDFTINGTSKSIMFYGDEAGEQAILQDLSDGQLYAFSHEDEEYKEYEDERYGRSHGDHDMSEQQELLMDMLVGDFKNQFQMMDNGDGSQTIIFELTDDEIPELLDVMASVAMSNKEGNYEENAEVKAECFEDYPIFDGFDMTDFAHPQLVDNVDITEIYFAIDVDKDGNVFAMAASFEITGDDEEGEYHELKFKANVLISDVNETVVDTIDVTDEDIITIECEGHDYQSNSNKGDSRR